MKQFFLLCIFWCAGIHASHAATTPPLISLHDSMASLDTYTWRASDGRSNGLPFQVGWRSDHVDIYTAPQAFNSQLRLGLNDVPCATNAALCANQAYAAGEYSSQRLVPFGSVTFSAQAAKANGVVTGLFLYTGASDGQPHDEIDIEFLGNNTTQVQLNYYVNGVGRHEAVLPLGFDAALSMHRYTIAWRDTSIDWYVDDVLLHSVNNTGQALPSHDMRIFSNVWATQGVDTWAGAFVYAKTPIYAYVDRIDYASWANKAIAIDSTGGGGCIESSMPAALWIILLSFVFLLGRRAKA